MPVIIDEMTAEVEPQPETRVAAAAPERAPARDAAAAELHRLLRRMNRRRARLLAD